MKKQNLGQVLLRNFNRYYQSIEEVDNENWIHLYANFHYNDAMDNFRMNEWKFKYINPADIAGVLAEGNREKIDDVLSEWGEDVKYTQSGSFDRIIPICCGFFNGKPGKRVQVEEICELPVGNYYFDWNYPEDGFVLEKDFVLQNVYIGLQRQSIDEALIKKSLDDFQGIEKYLYIRIDSENDMVMSCKITKGFLQFFDFQEDELWKQAEENTNGETILMDLTELFGLSPIPLQPFPMYVLTNQCKYRGASAILNKDVLKKFCNAFRTKKLIVISSSIHEWILIPGSMLDEYEGSLDDLTDMVREVNCTEVLPQEQLADRAYIITIDN